MTFGVGCGIALVIAVSALAGYLFVARSGGASFGGAAGPTMPRVFSLTPGTLAQPKGGGTTATLHITVEEGWSLEAFEFSAERIWTAELRRPAPAAKAAPALPITSSFDLVFNLPNEPFQVPEASVDLLLVELKCSAVKGGFFGTKSSFEGAHAFRFDFEKQRLIRDE